jgi:DNA (cytosine-5)-methyltransferase 1
MTAHPPEPKLRVLSLFAGIGGFELGLERTGGFETVAQCEIDPFCRKVLAKHWPNVKRYEDVRTLTADTLRRDGIEVDVICGGFPCQDISVAGSGIGLDGERSGLWSEIARLVGELRPAIVFVENVSALLSNGMGRVLGDLATLGYDAEWHCIPASAVGAPHIRDRVWIVAYPDSRQLRASGPPPLESWPANILEHGTLQASWVADWRAIVADVDSAVYGFSRLVDCLRPLGNAVVPQIPELIGNAILDARRAA